MASMKSSKLQPTQLPMTISTYQEIGELHFKGFRDWSRYGRVKASFNSGMLCFAPTEVLKFRTDWNPFEHLCHHLIVGETGHVAMKGYDKFFRVGENSLTPDTTTIVSASEKVDGMSFMVYYYGGWQVTSTKGFVSNTVNFYDDFSRLDLSEVHHEYMLIFEYICPEKRNIVDYGDVHAFVLLDIRHRVTMQMLEPEEVTNIARMMGCARPEQYPFDHIIQINEELEKEKENREGIVALLADGTRWKFKTDWYMENAVADMRFSKQSVAQMFLDGTYQSTFDASEQPFKEQMKRHKMALQLDSWHLDKSYRGLLRDYMEMNRTDARRFIHENETGLAEFLLDGLKGFSSDESYEDRLFTETCKIAVSPEDYEKKQEPMHGGFASGSIRMPAGQYVARPPRATTLDWGAAPADLNPEQEVNEIRIEHAAPPIINANERPFRNYSADFWGTEEIDEFPQGLNEEGDDDDDN
jgi:hypothetical protein